MGTAISNKFQAQIEIIEDAIINNTYTLEKLRKQKASYPSLKKIVADSGNATLLDETVKMEVLLDVNCVILIALLDLGVVFKNLLQTQGAWERIYFHKQGCLSIYESLKSYSHYQKQVKEIFSIHPKFKQEYEDISKTLRNFKKNHKYEPHMSSVRNVLAGHIHHDFIEYYDLASSLETEDIVNALAELIPILNRFLNLANDITRDQKANLDSRYEEIEKQIIEAISSIKQKLQNKNLR